MQSSLHCTSIWRDPNSKTTLYLQIKGTLTQTALLRKEMKMRDPAANTDTELWNENSDVRKNDPTTEVLLKLEGGINTADTVELESESDIPQVRKLEISSLDNCGGKSAILLVPFYIVP